MSKFIPQTTRQNGFSLLEVLIALVVFSIGLLGLAGLQIQGLKYNHEAYLRSQATLLAYDMLDRMRSNARGSSTLADYKVLATPVTTVPSANCAVVNCDSDQIAEFDIYEWKQAIANTLTKGTGQIEVLPGTPEIYTITIEYALEGKDKDKLSPTGATQDNARFVLSSAL